jgi:hypothetical protein
MRLKSSNVTINAMIPRQGYGEWDRRKARAKGQGPEAGSRVRAVRAPMRGGQCAHVAREVLPDVSTGEFAGTCITRAERRSSARARA